MNAATSKATSHLAGRWKNVDTAALSGAFGLLARGLPTSAAEIAEAAGISESRVARALGCGRVGKNEKGLLVAFFGVSISPASYRIRFESGELFTCCALVAVMMPLLIGREVDIAARDPETQGPIRVNVGLGRVMKADPPTTVATLVETEAEALLTDAGRSFCRHAKLFSSLASASIFEAADPRRRVVSLAELTALGRALYVAVWDHSLSTADS